jgi:hypothetical protein
VTIIFRSFNAFGRPSKGRILMTDSFKWTPEGFSTWITDRGKSPGMVRLRENKAYTHELAARLIKEKKQELKDGTSRRDVLSLLGSSCVAITALDVRCNSRCFS